MKLGITVLCALLINIYGFTQAFAQDTISVDVRAVVSDTSRRQIGVNTNYLLDDDANRTNALRGLAEALRQAGVKYLRYPGGEKSDTLLWSVWPYSTSIPTLARWAPQNSQDVEWPSLDPSLVREDGRTFAIDPLTFDEFMAVCRAIDCIPTVVVCYDSMYKPAQPGGVAPSRALLLETAREWVRYSNVTKGYNVKYWEIGNESYADTYNGSATAEDYARDLIEFSQVMKAVDPSIQIGANGREADWWQKVLPVASGAIDFLAVHEYPADGWGSYAYYATNAVDLLDSIRIAEHVLQTHAAPADRERISIAATEINSADWTGKWPPVNTLGHAIVLFDTIGELLQDPRVEFSEVWNTRWIGNDTATTPSLWDLLDKHNQLQATGRATSIWRQFLKDQLVATSSSQRVKAYTTYSPDTGKLSIFLINKGSDISPITLDIRNFSPTFTAAKWVLRGGSSEDTSPSWSYEGDETTPSSLALPPVSITVLDITPHASDNAGLTKIEAEDFDEGGFNDWSPQNYGGAYRSTAVDIEPTADAGGGYNIGWIEAGEWTEYSFEARAEGDYALALRVASPASGAAFRVLIDGVDVGGSVSVPNTGDWQRWATVSVASVHLRAGLHRLRVLADTDGFNINWISLQQTTTTSGHVVPGVIEAEDFDDGGFSDTTATNYGGEYRSTAVDIETCTDAGGGFNVGWMDTGEWMEYTISVDTPGVYQLALRVASPYDGRTVGVEIDGNSTGSVNVPNTAGWQSWQTIRANDVYLTAGTHRLRVVALSDLFNLNWISVQRSQ